MHTLFVTLTVSSTKLEASVDSLAVSIQEKTALVRRELEALIADQAALRLAQTRRIRKTPQAAATTPIGC